MILCGNTSTATLGYRAKIKDYTEIVYAMNYATMKCSSLPSTSNGQPIAVLSKKQESLASEEWLKATCVLEKNPPLMTPTILLLALHSKPPLYVINFMLHLNPQAASIPKKGPTALQIAVIRHAAHDVICRLLKACPFALLATTCDLAAPLELAMMHRHQEPDLIGILSQPLDYWMEQSKRTQKIVLPTTTKRGDPREIDNIKVIAATILRAQRRQMNALQEHKREVEEQLGEFKPLTQQDEAGITAKLLQEVADAQRKHFKTQLVALDMKERAVKTKFKQMERRLVSRLEETRRVNAQQEQKTNASIKSLEEMLKSFDAMVTNWQNQTEVKLEAIQSHVIQGSKVNAHFRNDTRLRLDQMFALEHNDGDGLYIAEEPIVYSTPYDSAMEYACEDKEPMLPKMAALQERRKKAWFGC